VTPDCPLVESYTSKISVFKFRGLELRFALSHGLFSSTGIDRGTALLLKVLSHVWDEDRAAGRPPSRRILDSGCGAGIIAICAAAGMKFFPGLPRASGFFHIRAQDRDELARLFTAYNARANGIGPDNFSAHTEPLLAGPPGSRWDLILSNIPAKAGRPVLEDFVRRSMLLLTPGGKALMVAVNTLADFFRSQIAGAGGLLVREEAGVEHTVFVYAAAQGAEAGTPGEPNAGPEPEAGESAYAGEGERSRSPFAETPRTGAGFLVSNPFYLRQKADAELAGIPLRLDTIHGAPGFDRPGGAAEAAAKLTRRLGMPALAAPASVLVHEPDQGWFPAWLLAFLEREGAGENPGRACPVSDMVLTGRNILALEAARHNARQAVETAAGPALSVIPAVELSTPGLAGLLENAGGAPAGRFGLIAVFPEAVPRTDRRAALWEGLAAFLAPGGRAVVSFPSSEADRFDRQKPPGFRRLGDLKRKGFRALAYEKMKEGKGRN
jgi:hypothetical protein